MRKRPVFLCLILLLISITACSAGHLGSSEIAFIRGGHLWTIDPSGANAFDVVNQTTPVVGYSWSPTHQILVFRTLDEQFAKTLAAHQSATNAITGQVADTPSVVNTIGVDGGSAIPIMLSDPRVQYSNPIWNSTGSRLIYRQEAPASNIPVNALWWVSQNDQPGGIAAKTLPSSQSLLSLSYTDSSAIGITKSGIFTAPLSGANAHFLVSGSLAGYPLPANLERVLWQPQHAHPLLLFAQAAATKQATGQFAEAAMKIQLVLWAPNGQEKTLTTCSCTQFAWSPDGTMVLFSTGQKDTIINIATGVSFDFPVEGSSVPYWSPNSKFLLLDGLHSLQMIDIAGRKQQQLLSDGIATSENVAIANVNALLQPAPNSLWAADSEHFIFLTRNRLNWQGQRLHPGTGLYTVSIDVHGQSQGIPTVVDTGNDTQAGWSYQDANTSFLY